MTAKASPTVYLWVKSEPFDVGIIPVPPPSKLTHHNLRKLYAYAKNKGKSGYPRLSYAVWKHVACNKLTIEEDLVWLYFHTCLSLTEHNAELHINNANLLSGCNTPEETSKIKDKMTVDLLQFILFLYVQHAQVISLKSAAVTGDEWPTRKSPDLDGRCSFGAKGIDEHTQMSFIISNITDILDLLVEPESYGDDTDVYLTPSAIRALSFLLGCTTDGKNVQSMDMIASLQDECTKAGFSKITKMFSCRRLQSWIKAYLRPNPFGVLSCLTLGQKLRGRGYSYGDESLNSSLSTSMGEELMHYNKSQIDWVDLQEQLHRDLDSNASSKSTQGNLVNKILTNTNYAPENMKMMICNQVCKRTVARTGDILVNGSLKIHRCQHSHLYLLAPIRSIIIDQCHDSTIVLGAVEVLVLVIGCENVNIVGVARRVVIRSSRDCNFYLRTSSEPILIGKNKNLRFAPYYTYYPNLEQDMHRVGIPPHVDMWSRVVTMSASKNETEASWKEMAVEDFFKFTIPFEMDGSTKTCPFALPSKYEEALRERETRITNWHQLIRESGLNKQERQKLQALVNDRFQEWLKETGNTQLLEGLTPPMPPTVPR